MIAGIVAGAPVAGGGSGFADAVLALSPWGYWKLDESGGTPATAVDSSGNGRDATYGSAGWTWGNAGLFGGSEESVTLNGNVRLIIPTLGSIGGGKLTLLCCFKTASSAAQHLISSDNTGASQRVWQWFIDSGTYGFVLFDGVEVVTGQGSGAADGNSHMALLVIDPTLAAGAGQVKMYADGTQIYASSVAMSITSTAATAPAFGSRSGAAQQEGFSGGADEIAIWLGTALSATEVADLWAARNTA